MQKFKFPQESAYKLWVLFADGNKGNFFSRDCTNPKSPKPDPKLGLFRLHKLIHNYGEKAEIAIIYDMKKKDEKGNTGVQVEMYKNGIKVE